MLFRTCLGCRKYPKQAKVLGQQMAAINTISRRPHGLQDRWQVSVTQGKHYVYSPSLFRYRLNPKANSSARVSL